MHFYSYSPVQITYTYLLKSNTQFIQQPSVETELLVHAIAQWLVLASYHEGPGFIPGQPM